MVQTLLFVAIVFFLFVFPQDILDSILYTIASQRVQWLTTILGAVGNITVAWVLSYLLFSSDSAFKGSSKTAKWARSQYASVAAKEKFNCTDGQASTLWFKYFDTWGLPNSPNHTLLVTSYSASYSARAVFFLQRALLIFLGLIILSIGLHWFLFDTYLGEEGSIQIVIHILVVMLFGASYVFLRITNRIAKVGNQATGCWARIENVFERSRTMFEHEILNHVSSLEAALDKVADLRIELLSPRIIPSDQ